MASPQRLRLTVTTEAGEVYDVAELEILALPPDKRPLASPDWTVIDSDGEACSLSWFLRDAACFAESTPHPGPDCPCDACGQARAEKRAHRATLRQHGA